VSDLYRAFRELHERPFPKNGTDPRVQELFASLVDYDGYVAGVVNRLLNGESAAELPPVRYNPELRTRLEAIFAESPSVAASEAGRLLEHLTRLEVIVGLALER
jgi:hypothetical protein